MLLIVLIGATPPSVSQFVLPKRIKTPRWKIKVENDMPFPLIKQSFVILFQVFKDNWSEVKRLKRSERERHSRLW